MLRTGKKTLIRDQTSESALKHPFALEKAPSGRKINSGNM
jgi:hypothetical protein